MSEGGGEPEQLAPVIPLFGRDAPNAKRVDIDSADAEPIAPHRADTGGVWRSTWSDDAFEKTESPLTTPRPPGPSDRHPARGGASRSAPRLRALRGDGQNDTGERAVDPTRVRDGAEELLVRKLRTRSLSISEARMVLRGYELDAVRLDASAVDDVIDDFCRRGYLDDAVLAGQIVASGVERKGQGRVALSRALAQRGIPRDLIDAALDELPDDDAERALEYARSKARGLSRLDGDTALRRLVGQLSRRGYSGAVAMTAAKQALAETTFGRPSGVRFVDSD